MEADWNHRKAPMKAASKQLRRADTAAALFALCLATACGEKGAARSGVPGPKATSDPMASSAAARFQLNLHFGGIEEPVLVVIDGKEVGPYRWDPTSRIDFVTIDAGAAPQAPPRVSARILLPCGWKEATLRERYRYPSGAVAVDLGGGFERRSILLDNRAGASETFRAGEWHRHVAANEVASFRMPVPDCETAELRLGSRVLGTFKESADRDDRAIYLVDPTGRRCYEYSIAAYRRPDHHEQPMVAPTARFGRKTLHRVPGPVDHVFEKAPATIKEWEGLKSATRSQLMEVGC